VTAKTLFEKIWEAHVVEQADDDWALLHIDRNLLHDLSGNAGLAALAARGLPLSRPNMTFATPDHAISSAPGRAMETGTIGATLRERLRSAARENGIRLFEVGEIGHGIVHVMSPELGLTLPGATLVCGDSHTCTNGGLGALAFGIGSSEVLHVLATQTLWQRKPRTMRVNFEGELARGVFAKDLILFLIGQLGAHAGTGFAVEYAGSAIASMSVEARMTICNLSIEMGAKIGMIAPDDKTIAYLQGRRYAPQGDAWDAAVQAWRTLPSDADARFDREVSINASRVVPMMTWGTSPEHVIPVDGAVPDPAAAPDVAHRDAWQDALDYMGLRAGRPLAGTQIDWVFIGSCTNSRLSDLRDAAALAKGQRVAKGVSAWVVPGSEAVKREAEAEGLDDVFRSAGFEWREPGCSMCVAANGETVPPGARCVSTSNRNFVGRQGPGARTHLASPQSAVAAAIAGAIIDVREFAHG
jgi:3-isopropylmalate/(R)-2-methylmalate dehydratase large subunit